MRKEWWGFSAGSWENEIDVRAFIQANYHPYTEDAAFLTGPTANTQALWDEATSLFEQESQAGGVLDMDTRVVSTITSHVSAYLDRAKERIVGFQTDKPLKRSLQPYGGIRMAERAAHDNGYKLDPDIIEFFTTHRKTHNQGVFDVYTPEMRRCRSSHIITGLPDAYGRGRIIGDYRRVALYGVDRLIEDKEKQKENTPGVMYGHVTRLREELSEQIRALGELKEMAAGYGFDISRPASTLQEAIQWLYFGYLAAVKEQNGAAMSLGRTSTFLDVYAERDLANGIITEQDAQELVDHFIMKLRMVRFARTPEYNMLFSGDPTWVTESIAGMGIDGRPLVTKMSFRYLQTLRNLGTAPEPNFTVLWSPLLPQNFKEFCAQISIETSSIQYENDDIMRAAHGDDYAIACCVSSMKVGKEMQFFGARANLAKCLLYAINGGVDEVSGKQIGPKFRAVLGDVLDYDDVRGKFSDMMRWLAGVYVNMLNIIHYMHDKYSYERLQMALHDKNVTRWFATGIAGLSVVADSLSAIKYARVSCIRNEAGIVTDYVIDGEYPAYGNDDDRVDTLAREVVSEFMGYIKQNHTYRNSIPTTSILTITSNVVYGKNTGATPDGRAAGEPFAPGANPMHKRDKCGAIASLASVSKLPFNEAKDGISNTFSIVPSALGKEDGLIVAFDCGCSE